MTDKILIKVPQHVAIIMDGNGRWARQQTLSRLEGHKRGSEVARDIVTTAARAGVSYLTLYAFSSENWRRDPHEVSGLMGLLKHYLEDEAEELYLSNYSRGWKGLKSIKALTQEDFLEWLKNGDSFPCFQFLHIKYSQNLLINNNNSLPLLILGFVFRKFGGIHAYDLLKTPNK